VCEKKLLLRTFYEHNDVGLVATYAGGAGHRFETVQAKERLIFDGPFQPAQMDEWVAAIRASQQ